MSRRLTTYEWYASATVYLTSALGTGLGVAILLGGERRFSGPGFAVARLAPGGYLFWGGGLALLGLLMVFGIVSGWRARVISSTFLGMAAWYLFFALSLVITASRNPAVAFTGVFAYGGLCALCVLGWACGEGLRRG